MASPTICALVEDLDLWLRIARRHPIGWCGQECLLRGDTSDNISRDSEAMGYAYLEVLRRHRISWAAPGVAAMRPDAGQLASRKYLYLAELAMTQGKPGAALRACLAQRRVVAAPADAVANHQVGHQVGPGPPCLTREFSGSSAGSAAP